MKKIILGGIALLAVLEANSQTTWSENAAQVLYDNCTSCHNPNGIGPNSFLDYSSTVPYSALIKNYVENNIMPPWTADSSFQHYSGERLLTQTERDIIINWVNDGALEGNSALAPPPPVYNGEQLLAGTPDLVVQMPVYMSKATPTSDDYVCIAIPTGLATTRRVKAIEVIPGNRSIVHHCLVFADASATYVTDTVGGDCGGPSSGDLMAGYTPGATPAIFPSTSSFSAGMVLSAGSNVILAMHYPEGSYGEFDQTTVNFYFYPEPVVNFREVFAQPLIQNWTFNIAANTIDSVETSISGIPFDYSLMSVFPHMHLLGTYIESYGIDPLNDTIPFVRIPQWDFEWQDFYFFDYMKQVPAGSTIYGKGIYDNTASNPNNPNDPPINVGAGLNTSDEMFLIYYHYMLYQSGDESINIDSLNNEYMILLSTLNEDKDKPFGAKVYPNPFQNEVIIEYILTNPSFVSLYIYDLNGRIINKLARVEQESGTQQIVWDGTNDYGESVSSGIYYYSMLIDGVQLTGKIIKQ